MKTPPRPPQAPPKATERAPVIRTAPAVQRAPETPKAPSRPTTAPVEPPNNEMVLLTKILGEQEYQSKEVGRIRLYTFIIMLFFLIPFLIGVAFSLFMLVMFLVGSAITIFS